MGAVASTQRLKKIFGERDATRPRASRRANERFTVARTRHARAMSRARGGFRARRRGSGEHVVRETRRWGEGVTGAYLSLSLSRRLPTRFETTTTTMTTTRRVVFARATSPDAHGSTDDATRA
jgi:hypothetical protein